MDVLLAFDLRSALDEGEVRKGKMVEILGFLLVSFQTLESGV